ncbi:MAG: tRNA guanosine(34) transglycosylase Tgt [Candidatus Schekmanbacteria bacterium]|nr:tRNA guanosine(34) transglycosylase Tgt [Candidatus Schekmanbacteria bacterium]
MNPGFRFDLFGPLAAGGPRRGTMCFPRGQVVQTPAFLAVATQATVKALDPERYVELGGQAIISNTYHLFLRPGHELIRRLGGLHRFMGFGGAILTDSGGFQSMSLGKLVKIGDEGISFRSHLDGGAHLFTPEIVVDIQSALGSDVVLPIDVCAAGSATAAEQRLAMNRTVAWAKRTRQCPLSPEQAMFGIVQGGFEESMRLECASAIAELGFDGHAIGGLSVGEERSRTIDTARLTAAALPADRPRYVMGMGRPWEVVELVDAGVDLMDCVLPTRMARNGRALTSCGELNLRNARFRDDPAPLDPVCTCGACARFSRAYLRQLCMAREIFGMMLLTEHNVCTYLHLFARIRQAIEAGTFSDLKREAQSWKQ